MCEKLEKYFNKKIKKITLWDFALIKTCLIIFGIMIGAYISNFVKINIWYFLIAFVILYVYTMMKFFKK